MMDIDELIDYVDEVFDSALAKKARAELTTLRAENERLRGHVENIEAYALDIDRRVRGKGNPKWIPLHTEEIINDIAWCNKEALK